jgi:hypothetical protein
LPELSVRPTSFAAEVGRVEAEALCPAADHPDLVGGRRREAECSHDLMPVDGLRDGGTQIIVGADAFTITMDTDILSMPRS